MKNFIFLISFLAFCRVGAQTSNERFITLGKEWHVRKMYPAVSDIYYRLDGDTVIGGNICMKMYVSYGSKPEESWANCVAALYEDGDKVYCFDKGNTVSRILYDFSLKAGDIVPGTIPNTMVTAVDEINIKEKKFRRIFIQNTDGENEYTNCWVEGIGSGVGPLYSGVVLPGCYESLQSCILPDGTVISDYDITMDIQVVHSGYGKQHKGIVYDLSGRKVTDVQRPGIYIKDGTKVVVK